MSPFAGEGVNVAIKDAAKLTLSIIQHKDINTAIEVYEEEMYTYSSISAEISYINLELYFSDDAATKTLDHMNQYYEHH
ncbi:hypothetical protein D0U04_19670 [Bacillus clarus]|nr:hypothetical protein D0U04_19670 [Bacillus clarus]